MLTQSHLYFARFAHELAALSRRDVTQGYRLAKYKMTALSMLENDREVGNTFLGFIACMEHDLPAMHLYHKRAIEAKESSFSLMYYAASLDKSCFWNESVKYALLALDQEPANQRLLEVAIALAPLAGSFSLLKKLLSQRPLAGVGKPHPREGDAEVAAGILAKNYLLEKDLRAGLIAIGEALSETEVILERYQYDLVTEGDKAFIHYRFVVPENSVPSYYEDQVAVKLDATQLHPRLFDGFSYSIENSAVYELYEYMDNEMGMRADTIVIPDPEKMKLIEDLIEGVEI